MTERNELTADDRRLGAAVVASFDAAARGMSPEGWSALLSEIQRLTALASMLRVTNPRKRRG